MKNKWHLNHTEENRAKVRKWRKDFPSKALSYLQEWRKTHPEKVVFYNAIRRARRRGGEGTYTYEQWVTLKQQYGNMCLCCKKTEEELHSLGRVLVPDHVVPLCKNGNNLLENIQPLCHGKDGCNNKKASQIIDYRAVPIPSQFSENKAEPIVR